MGSGSGAGIVGDDAIIVCVANLVWLVCRSFSLLDEGE